MSNARPQTAPLPALPRKFLRIIRSANATTNISVDMSFLQFCTPNTVAGPSTRDHNGSLKSESLE